MFHVSLVQVSYAHGPMETFACMLWVVSCMVLVESWGSFLVSGVIFKASVSFLVYRGPFLERPGSFFFGASEVIVWGIGDLF